MEFSNHEARTGETRSRLALFFSLAGMVSGLFAGWVLDVIQRPRSGQAKQERLPRKDPLAAHFKERVA